MKLLRSLHGQLTVAIGAVLAIGLGLLLIIAGTQMSQMTTEAFTHEQQVTGLVMANGLADYFENERGQQLMSAWTSQSGEWRTHFPSDTNLSMYNAQGTLIASSIANPGSIPGDDLSEVLKGSILSNIINGRLYTEVPVIHEHLGVLGVIQIDSSLDMVNQRLSTRWLTLIGAALAALVLAFFVAYWLARQLTQPLSELHAGAEKMSQGQLDARVELGDTVTELESLGTMFNYMAEQVEEMVQEQRDFVANASHELRSPLASIKLRAEALAQQNLDGDRARQYAAEIDDEVSQLAALVNDLLQLSHVESGVFTLPEQPIAVSDELQSCVRSARPSIAAKHQQLEVTLADDLPSLYIHPNDLRIMVSNLLDNASKYTPDGGHIGLKAVWNAQRLAIEVSDTGEGILPEDLPRLTERFFRVDRAHTQAIHGFGLGLSLVSAIAQHYRGLLRIESTGVPGEGTHAFLELPLTHEPAH